MMTKREDQILPPSTLRAVDEWERESEIGRSVARNRCIGDLSYAEANAIWARVQAQQDAYWQRQRDAVTGVSPLHEQNRILLEHDQRERQQATTMPSPADRKLTSRQFVAALAAAFAAGWGAVELVRWVVE